MMGITHAVITFGKPKPLVKRTTGATCRRPMREEDVPRAADILRYCRASQLDRAMLPATIDILRLYATRMSHQDAYLLLKRMERRGMVERYSRCLHGDVTLWVATKFGLELIEGG